MMPADEFNEICENTRFLGRFILFALFVCLLLVGTMALGATYTMQDRQGNVVMLYDQPCEQRGWFSTWKKAQVKYQGKDYEACWSAVGGNVLVFDSAGDLTPVPIQMFRKMQEG